MSILFSIKEKTLQGMILRWIDESIKQLRLPFTAHQELEIKTPTGKRKIPDIVLLDEKGKIVLTIELKPPYRSPMDDEVVNQALNYAVLTGSPFFATWNINTFVLWETFTPGTSLLERRSLIKDVADLRRLDERILQDKRLEERVKEFLREFLPHFKQYLDSKLKQPSRPVLKKLAPDELLVSYLRYKVNALSLLFYPFLLEKAKADASLLSKIRSWFVEQGWIFTEAEDDYYRVARQQVYLIILKILFYNILKQKFRLQDINVNGVAIGVELKERLQEYFNASMDINPRYGIIFASNLIEELPVPDEAVDDLKGIITHLNQYDFSKLGYDIIGKVYEKLLPPAERHKLGQYFTPNDIVDLIIGFTVKDPNARVLDPSCGSGTFLVRAYHRKKYLARLNNKEKTHRELINELYGVDISKFPAVLSTINLLKENIRDVEIVPKIINMDFFDVRAKSRVLPYKLVKGFESREKDFVIELPSEFDAVITNPPYTRQEEMEDFLQEEKEKAWKVCVGDWKAMSGSEEAIGKRSSIYAYFFIHGGVFLREKGRLGFITSNTWLDVDYGVDVKKFFLQNFKIIAIIESKVERWFEDAEVDTAITILERCSNKEERDEHLVKFIQLKVPLNQLIPPTSNEEERWKAVDSLVDKIESLTDYYEDDKMRVFPKKQKELWDEGYDPEEKEYVGSKWGKYIRAPPIFFKILEKGKNILIPLKEIAEVRRGFTTGANEFFYLTEEEIKRWGIEREFWMHPVKRDEWVKIKDYIPQKDMWIDKGGNYFKQSQYADIYKLDEVLIDGNVIWIPNYVVKSPKECEFMVVDPRSLKLRVLLIQKDKSELGGKKVINYIQHGEKERYHERDTCANRQPWYRLTPIDGDILCMMTIREKHMFWNNAPKCYFDARMYGIIVKEGGFKKELVSVLNSTLTFLFIELWGRQILGPIDVKVYEYKLIPVIDVRRINKSTRDKLVRALSIMEKRKIHSIFVEIGADSPEKVSLDKVMPDRRELDKIVMGDILGLTEEEQLEVYKAVVDLVRSRVGKATSAGKRKKEKKNNIDKLVSDLLNIMHETISRALREFPEDYLPPDIELVEQEIPQGRDIAYGIDLVRGFHVRIDDKVLSFPSPHEAKYVYYAALSGRTRVKLPVEADLVKEIVQRREKDLKEVRQEIEKHLETYVADRKIRSEVLHRILSRLKIPEKL